VSKKAEAHEILHSQLLGLRCAGRMLHQSRVLQPEQEGRRLNFLLSLKSLFSGVQEASTFSRKGDSCDLSCGSKRVGLNLKSLIAT
jgi:hypothetical protein